MENVDDASKQASKQASNMTDDRFGSYFLILLPTRWVFFSFSLSGLAPPAPLPLSPIPFPLTLFFQNPFTLLRPTERNTPSTTIDSQTATSAVSSTQLDVRFSSILRVFPFQSNDNLSDK